MTKRLFKRKNYLNPKEVLHKQLCELLSKNEKETNLPDDVPSKWEKHEDLILLPHWSFRSEIWSSYGESLWDIVADSLKCCRIARKNSICNDNYRSPRIELLKGSHTWVVHIDNKIKYTFDAAHCMFSAGNITEKLRIAQLSCENEVVVDLYAGIGYFTLPFLVHAKASMVHACEWNPYAVEAISKTLLLNGVSDKCVIHFGDNREVCPKNIADRVNLGLIPSSEDGWETACKALKSSGGILHVHGNVTSNLTNLQTENFTCCSPLKLEWTMWSQDVRKKMKSILFKLHKTNWNVKVYNIMRVKSYAPHIDHLVVDLVCKPNHDLIRS